MLIALLVAVFCIIGVDRTSAEVYEWSDANGRHYSDSLEAIPKDLRPQARLMIKETSPAPAAPPTPVSAATNEPEEPTTFASGWDSGFEAGWAAGFQAASNQQPVCTAEPEIIVLQSAPPVTLTEPRYSSYGGYYVSPYEGTVTQPFDGGRSFGLTRREQMQRLQGR
jgi:hypothetical protein